MENSRGREKNVSKITDFDYKTYIYISLDIKFYLKFTKDLQNILFLSFTLLFLDVF